MQNVRKSRRAASVMQTPCETNDRMKNSASPKVRMPLVPVSESIRRQKSHERCYGPLERPSKERPVRLAKIGADRLSSDHQDCNTKEQTAIHGSRQLHLA